MGSLEPRKCTGAPARVLAAVGRSVQTDAVMRDSGYSIVRAHRGHLDALPAIELAAAQLLKGHAPDSALNETTNLRTFSDASEHGRLWVALFGDTPVGFALVRMLACDLPHLDELDVAPSHGRRGLGTALVRAVCEWTSASGYSVLTLTTFRAVPWNLPFYSRLGFTEVAADGLRPELAAVVAAETARGLRPDTRAVMSYQCAPCDHQTSTHRPLSAAR
jgi:GNAT superfamily N-acetyltransferase